MNPEIVNMINATYVVRNREWRLLSNGRKTNTATMLAHLSQLISNSQQTHLFTELVNLPAWLEEQTQQPQQQEVIDQTITPEKYIIDTLKRHDIQIEGRGDKFTKLELGTEVRLNSDEIVTLLKGDLWEFNRFLPRVNKLKEGDIVNKFNHILLNKSLDTTKSLLRHLTYNQRNVAIVDTWLEDLHKVMQIKEPINVWKMLMKHMMWLVKRHLYNKQVKNDIWIQIMGKYQASGKTYTARECIFYPLRDMYLETELSKIEDIDREVSKFTKYLVVNFDEIALGNAGDPQYRIGKKMLNNLKSILTRDEITVRTYHTQHQEKQKKSFTAFSTANTHLYDVIYDETGMRRFFEFNTVATTQFDNIEIAKLREKAFDAWTGINEGIVEGYWDKASKEGKYITEAQESYFPTYSTVKMWATDRNVREGNTLLTDAFSAYRDYCRETGNTYICSQQSFINDMRKLYKHLIKANGVFKIDFEEF